MIQYVCKHCKNVQYLVTKLVGQTVKMYCRVCLNRIRKEDYDDKSDLS